MARMFRIGNATYCYYNQVKDLPVFDSGNPNDEPAVDLLEWLEQQLTPDTGNRSARELLQVYFEEYMEGLTHDGLRRAEKEAGLDKAKNSFPFRRYVLERHDIGMNESLRQHLSQEDYAFHVESDRSIDDSPPAPDQD